MDIFGLTGTLRGEVFMRVGGNGGLGEVVHIALRIACLGVPSESGS